MRNLDSSFTSRTLVQLLLQSVGYVLIFTVSHVIPVYKEQVVNVILIKLLTLLAQVWI